MALPANGGYFSPVQLQTLAGVSARLIPQEAAPNGRVDLPAALDLQLSGGIGKGWRYEVLPPDEVLFKQGMDQIENLAQHLYQRAFSDLNTGAQEDLLLRFQEGKTAGIPWPAEVSKRFFGELLAALTALYYSHPIGRAEIGDRSFADLPDWQAIGLNEEEPPENSRKI